MQTKKYIVFGLLSILNSTGCVTKHELLNPLGAEFGLVSDLSLRFALEDDLGFKIEINDGDGNSYTAFKPYLVYKCAGREQEYFGFEESADGHVNVAPRDQRIRKLDIPHDLKNIFSDRTKASESDAVKSIFLSLRTPPNTNGIADYITFEDGWLIAYDLGEFAGALIWLPIQGDSYFISTENTADLEPVGDGVYAAQGLDHLALTGGKIELGKRYERSIQIGRENGVPIFKPQQRWLAYEETYAAASAVIKIRIIDDMIVGLTNYGLFVIGNDGIVRYNNPIRYDHQKVVQNATDLFVDKNGVAYVGGPDMIGIYSGLPENLIPHLYARKDCDFIFEDAVERSG